MAQGGQRADRAVHAAGVVEVGPAPTGRRRAGEAGQVSEAAEGLGGGSHGAVPVVATGVTEAGHGHVDNVGTDLLELLIAEAPPLHDAAAEVFDDHVGYGDEPLNVVQPFLSAGVDADAAFVGVRVGKLAGGVGSRLDSRRNGEAVLAQGVEVQRPLDFDDLCAQGAQPAGSPGAGADPGEVDDANALQRGWQGHR